MRITIVDLCGRSEPCTIDANDPDQCAKIELTDDDFDHIADMWAAGRPAYIGEFEYRRA